MLLHQRMRALEACGHTSWRKCHFCKQYDKPENLYISNYGGVYHGTCRAAYNEGYNKKNRVKKLAYMKEYNKKIKKEI